MEKEVGGTGDPHMLASASLKKIRCLSYQQRWDSFISKDLGLYLAAVPCAHRE